MTRYYIVDQTAEHGFIELNESEWLMLMGDKTIRPYAVKVYREKMTIDEVPEELREAVQTVVDAKIARWGLYSERDIPDSEALNIIVGG